MVPCKFGLSCNEWVQGFNVLNLLCTMRFLKSAHYSIDSSDLRSALLTFGFSPSGKSGMVGVWSLFSMLGQRKPCCESDLYNLGQR